MHATATGDVELVGVIDEDDPLFDDYRGADTFVIAPAGTVHSDLWNQAWEAAHGDIAFLGADDLIFRTIGWDEMITEAIDELPDRIAMAYGDDGTPPQRATHPAVSREWIDCVGWFTPPYFASWYADRWIWDVADLVGRRRFLPDVLIEHMHPAWGKAADDPLYAKHTKARRGRHIAELYHSKADERTAQAAALLSVMA